MDNVQNGDKARRNKYYTPIRAFLQVQNTFLAVSHKSYILFCEKCQTNTYNQLLRLNKKWQFHFRAHRIFQRKQQSVRDLHGRNKCALE